MINVHKYHFHQIIAQFFSVKEIKRIINILKFLFHILLHQINYYSLKINQNVVQNNLLRYLFLIKNKN